MIYKFTIVSDEVDDFMREIKIDSDATFFDFHKAILAACGYKDDQMTSFFICDDNWEKEKEVTLEDMGSSSEEDSWIMKDTRLDDLVEDEKQRLLYVFDPLTERVFFIELTETIPGKSLDKPVCSRKHGEAPKQSIDFDELNKNSVTSSIDLDENFYGDQSFDPEDFDPDGYEMEGGGNEEERY